MKKSDKKKRSLLGALPAVPYVVWMVLFIAIPLGMVAFFALTDPQKRRENPSVLPPYDSISKEAPLSRLSETHTKF